MIIKTVIVDGYTIEMLNANINPLIEYGYVTLGKMKSFKPPDVPKECFAQIMGTYYTEDEDKSKTIKDLHKLKNILEDKSFLEVNKILVRV